MLQSTDTQNMKAARRKTVKIVICLSGGNLNDLVIHFSHMIYFIFLSIHFPFVVFLCSSVLIGARGGAVG